VRPNLAIHCLDDHPNADEIVGVLAHMVDLDDTALSLLATAWRNDARIAAARAAALSPDTPLVLEALAAFDSLAFLYADDLEGQADFVTLPAPVVALALKAVRDAIAAAYARPVLSKADHERLMAPWRSVFADTAARLPDFGPQHHEVLEMLAGVPLLACRTHDPVAVAQYDSLVACGLTVDPGEHALAFDRAWHAAVTTRRRRLWQLATRSCHEAYFRRCGACEPGGGEDERLVLALCLGAVLGVLMSDVLDDADLTTLTTPAALLVPRQRTP
jgi:hypothetical protein